MHACRQTNKQTSNASLDRHALVQVINRISATDIDILREQLVRHPVFLQYVIVGARARKGGAEEEAKHSVGKKQKSDCDVLNGGVGECRVVE